MVREKVLQALYAHELSEEPLEQAVEEILGSLKKHKGDFEFAKELLTAVLQYEEELDTIIKLKTANWQFDRIAIIDMLLLRMGICEFLYFPDIPPKVTINEAIEIAHSFSTEKSGQFVNGVLDAVLTELRTSGKLIKTGRGLVNSSSHASTSPRTNSPTKKKR